MSKSDRITVASVAPLNQLWRIFGPPHEHAAGQRNVVRKPHDSVCHLAGAQQPRWYAAFDAFLLTSANEGAPVVAIEAQSAGVPVVATDAGGTRTVVDDGETGFIVDIGDVSALSDRLRQLRDETGLRRSLGATGAERMRDKFSIERMADDIDRLYAEIAPR